MIPHKISSGLRNVAAAVLRVVVGKPVNKCCNCTKKFGHASRECDCTDACMECEENGKREVVQQQVERFQRELQEGMEALKQFLHKPPKES